MSTRPPFHFITASEMEVEEAIAAAIELVEARLAQR